MYAHKRSPFAQMRVRIIHICEKCLETLISLNKKVFLQICQKTLATSHSLVSLSLSLSFVFYFHGSELVCRFKATNTKVKG